MGPSRRGDRQAREAYWGAGALPGSALAGALHLSSSAAVKARPSTRKLSTLPARFASDWQSTAGRLSWVEPWQASEPHAQTMSRAMKRCVVGAASFAE